MRPLRQRGRQRSSHGRFQAPIRVLQWPPGASGGLQALPAGRGRFRRLRFPPRRKAWAPTQLSGGWKHPGGRGLHGKENPWFCTRGWQSTEAEAGRSYAAPHRVGGLWVPLPSPSLSPASTRVNLWSKWTRAVAPQDHCSPLVASSCILRGSEWNERKNPEA